MRYLLAFTLNALDGIATTVGMSLGYVAEANPLLAGMSASSILAVKLLPISFLVLVLYNHRDNRLSAIGTLLVCGVYLHITILHCQWIGAVI